MTICRLSAQTFERLDSSFDQQGVKERGDLQRLLRADFSVIDPDVMIIAEEFCEWEDSLRRIDLLGVDTRGNIVVIELKRDASGGHMDLQALRYAAMVSGMTFARAVQVYQSFLGSGGDAAALLLNHLGWDEAREEEFGGDVRVILIAADFSKELTTAVLWLNQRDLDVTCVRLKPYRLKGETIVDVQRIVPLPEAQDFVIKFKQKEQAVRHEKAERHQSRRQFWETLLAGLPAGSRFDAISAGEDCWIGAASGHSGVRFVYLAWTDSAAIELYIDRGVGSEAFNKSLLNELRNYQQEIEQAFGKPLTWDDIPGRRAARLRSDGISGGVYSPREDWPRIQGEMIAAMGRFEAAIGGRLGACVAAAAAKR